MKRIVLASNNKHKVKEFKEIMQDYQIITLKEIGYFEDIEETGKTFEENALIKATTIHQYLKEKGEDCVIVSDDSGLCVESLGGLPGVYSARYAGVHDNAQANRDKLQQELIGKNREAYFECTIVAYYPDGHYKVFTGKSFGKITEEERGDKEFGYDCIFYSNDLKKTFGEASEDEENSVSHRGRAIQELLKEIEE